MARSVWWALAVAALAFTAWNATSLTMLDVSMACSKIGESRSYQCGDRAIDVLGVWPLVGVGLLVATPPAVAAIAMRKSASWLAVAVLLGRQQRQHFVERLVTQAAEHHHLRLRHARQ